MAVHDGPKVLCYRCGAEVSTLETLNFGWRIRSHLCAGIRASQRALYPNESAQVEAAIAAQREAQRVSADSSAVISEDGLYRYELRRKFADAEGSDAVLWVMLNPSTADGELDDPTVRKCREFSRRIRPSAARMVVANLFALRETSPSRLRDAIRQGRDAVGPENDSYLERLVSEASVVVCAWGAHPLSSLRLYGGPERVDRVLSILSRVRGAGMADVVCLGRSAGGAPSHPLMLAYATAPEPFLRTDGGAL